MTELPISPDVGYDIFDQGPPSAAPLPWEDVFITLPEDEVEETPSVNVPSDKAISSSPSSSSLTPSLSTSSSTTDLSLSSYGVADEATAFFLRYGYPQSPPSSTPPTLNDSDEEEPQTIDPKRLRTQLTNGALPERYADNLPYSAYGPPYSYKLMVGGNSHSMGFDPQAVNEDDDDDEDQAGPSSARPSSPLLYASPVLGPMPERFPGDWDWVWDLPGNPPPSPIRNIRLAPSIMYGDDDEDVEHDEDVEDDEDDEEWIEDDDDESASDPPLDYVPSVQTVYGGLGKGMGVSFYLEELLEDEEEEDDEAEEDDPVLQWLLSLSHLDPVKFDEIEESDLEEGCYASAEDNCIVSPGGGPSSADSP